MPRKTVQLKKSKSRRASSSDWLKRQLNDRFTERARKEGFRARSIYKLKEIDEKYELLRPGLQVVDLGAAPGSWSQYAAKRQCHVLAIDLEEIEPIAPRVIFFRGDFLERDTLEHIEGAQPRGFDLILSDMAASSTGQRAVDRLKAEALGEAVLDFAERNLKQGGNLVTKLLKGAETPVLSEAKRSFATTRLIKPKATRSESSEIYLVALNHRYAPKSTSEMSTCRG